MLLLLLLLVCPSPQYASVTDSDDDDGDDDDEEEEEDDDVASVTGQCIALSRVCHRCCSFVIFHYCRKSVFTISCSLVSVRHCSDRSSFVSKHLTHNNF